MWQYIQNNIYLFKVTRLKYSVAFRYISIIQVEYYDKVLQVVILNTIVYFE